MPWSKSSLKFSLQSSDSYEPGILKDLHNPINCKENPLQEAWSKNSFPHMKLIPNVNHGSGSIVVRSDSGTGQLAAIDSSLNPASYSALNKIKMQGQMPKS